MCPLRAEKYKRKGQKDIYTKNNQNCLLSPLFREHNQGRRSLSLSFPFCAIPNFILTCSSSPPCLSACSSTYKNSIPPPKSHTTAVVNLLITGDYHGSYRGLKPARYMALTDTWVMCGGTNNSESHYSWSRIFVMELGPDWTKHRKLPAYTAHVMRSATFFMPWSCKIIGDGYHELH